MLVPDRAAELVSSMRGSMCQGTAQLTGSTCIQVWLLSWSVGKDLPDLPGAAEAGSKI